MSDQMSELADEHGMTLHYGRKEKQHVHEWSLYETPREGAEIICGCGETMSFGEVERRLNATEMLSAEDAMPTFDKVVAKFTSHVAIDDYTVAAVVHHLRKVYRPYASALEGEWTDDNIQSTHYTAEEMDVDVLHHNPKDGR